MGVTELAAEAGCSVDAVELERSHRWYHASYNRCVTEITIRELRNHGDEMVDRVMDGERMIVTRDGRPVAQFRPLERQPLSIQAIQRRWSKLPPMDPDSLRRGIDAIVEQE